MYGSATSDNGQVLHHAHAQAIGPQTEAVVERIGLLLHVTESFQRENDDVGGAFRDVEFPADLGNIEPPAGTIEALEDRQRSFYRGRVGYIGHVSVSSILNCLTERKQVERRLLSSILNEIEPDNLTRTRRPYSVLLRLIPSHDHASSTMARPSTSTSPVHTTIRSRSTWMGPGVIRWCR